TLARCRLSTAACGVGHKHDSARRLSAPVASCPPPRAAELRPGQSQRCRVFMCWSPCSLGQPCSGSRMRSGRRSRPRITARRGRSRAWGALAALRAAVPQRPVAADPAIRDERRVAWRVFMATHEGAGAVGLRVAGKRWIAVLTLAVGGVALPIGAAFHVCFLGHMVRTAVVAAAEVQRVRTVRIARLAAADRLPAARGVVVRETSTAAPALRADGHTPVQLPAVLGVAEPQTLNPALIRALHQAVRTQGWADGSAGVAIADALQPGGHPPGLRHKGRTKPPALALR